ncbi:DUF4136 domain-containing protein [Winogradskyella alexanderae]|uniref:DUF4136 domain-containing protein n=1 Tax=Winogradskyella alexanderae TaxID=2877123 RepID=A0ABS7XXQ4_9FLAO|nr:DUF4136 domain-containing protein [Winogradskyella alexanderae]MCA0133601.1 DUF4136 domain-containing protein [Winogradskyella alexanderae]
MKALKYILLFAFMSSCGPLIYYDYEETTDFTQYKSYSYFDDMETGLSVLDQKRIMRAIDAELQKVGIERKTNADFYIDISSRDIQPTTNSSFGIGMGGTGGNVGGAISVGVPVGGNLLSREITIDFVDLSEGEKLVWQAVCESLYKPNDTPEKRDEHFNKLIGRIFSKYPPKG